MKYKEADRRFGAIYQQIDRAYDDYARSVGTSYTGLYLFEHILEGVDSQKGLCDATLLPKQTVHSTVSVLEKQGLLVQGPDPADGRRRRILLTEAGAAFGARALPGIAKAVEAGLAGMSRGEQEQLFALLERYANGFSAHIRGEKE